MRKFWSPSITSNKMKPRWVSIRLFGGLGSASAVTYFREHMVLHEVADNPYFAVYTREIATGGLEGRMPLQHLDGVDCNITTTSEGGGSSSSTSVPWI